MNWLELSDSYFYDPLSYHRTFIGRWVMDPSNGAANFTSGFTTYAEQQILLKEIQDGQDGQE